MLLKELRTNPNNPRTLTKEDFEILKKKIKSFPQMLEKRPIVYVDGIVLGGNQRLEVLKELEKEGFEIKESYFADASDWSEENRRQFVITDNISDGGWDYDVLANEWDDLPLEEWGINTSGWGNIEEDEAAPIEEGEPDSKLGELYQLGKHRIM